MKTEEFPFLLLLSLSFSKLKGNNSSVEKDIKHQRQNWHTCFMKGKRAETVLLSEEQQDKSAKQKWNLEAEFEGEEESYKTLSCVLLYQQWMRTEKQRENEKKALFARCTRNK